MKSNSLIPIDFERPVSRSTVASLLYTALRIKQFRFARQSALAWLATFPGDLEINMVLAQAMYGEERFSSISTIVDDLCQRDPEFVAAQQLRTLPQITKNQDARYEAYACLHALNGSTREGVPVPEWAHLTWNARQAFQAGDLAQAERLIHQALVNEPACPLTALLHCQITFSSQDPAGVHTLAELYNSRWPDCLQFKLYLADTLIHSSDEGGAVSLLHQCAAQDAAGQVPGRIWGSKNPYQNLWPTSMEILFDLPIPAPVAAAMGWNMLGGGPAPAPAPAGANSSIGAEKSKPQPERMSPDMLRQIQDEFDRLGRRLRRKTPGREDGRFPVYVILSSATGLKNIYGPQTASVLQDEMKSLATAVRKRHSWGAITFFPDDSASASSYGIKPVPYNDPWKVKLTLTDLDASLGKKGEMIGAVLIVGGPEVVPYHRLPNPTNDGDADVPSDNPYASLDQNYFIPDWPVGRLPGGSSSDAGLLLAGLRRLVAYHNRQNGSTTLRRGLSFLQRLLRGVKKILPKGIKANAVRPSYGYSAAVWKQSSQAVYRPIGDPQTLDTSPPSGAGKLTSAHLTYFNLHGLQDGADWYGQREVSDASGAPDYPVALTPKDVPTNGQGPKIVFSEACYGAHIEDKVEDQSIALTLISNGCLALVGSTCISYGSVTTPLIAADLFGYYFWKNIKDGKNTGEAFQQAKISLVNEMNKRQGYLDGEDQKTLISFNLYGDPLVTYEEFAIRNKKVTRPMEHPVVKVICDFQDEAEETQPVPAEMLNKVKKLVGQYLPGLQDAELIMNPQMGLVDEEGHAYTTPQMGTRHTPKTASRNTVIRLSKQVEFARHIHYHYARLTIDTKGRLLKVSVSR